MKNNDQQGKKPEQVEFSIIVGWACFVAIIVLVLFLKIFN